MPIACPAWCGKPAGHGFELEEPADPALVFRFHRLTIAEVGTERGPGVVSVTVECLESARSGRLVERTPVVVSVFGYSEGDAMDGPQARQLAAALLAAAGQWDRITEASW